MDGLSPEQSKHLGRLINELTKDYPFRVGDFQDDQIEEFLDAKPGFHKYLLIGPANIYVEFTRSGIADSTGAYISIESFEQYGIPFDMANQIAINNGLEGVFTGYGGMSALGYSKIPIFPKGEEPLTAEKIVGEYVHKVHMAVKEIVEVKRTLQNV